jgi:hypothetical protein
VIIPERFAIDDGFSCHVAKEVCLATRYSL